MQAMTRHMSFYDLQAALVQPGCPVCRLAAEVAERYLDFILWERVMDPDLRRELRDARGFCRDHAWALVRPGSSLGIAVMLRDVLQDLLGSLDVAAEQPAANARRPLRRLRETIDPQPPEVRAVVAARLDPQAEQSCPACVQCRVMEEVYLDVLLDNLTGADNLLDAYQSSDGLCLSHFRQAVRRVRSQPVLDTLLHAQRTIWERLDQQLGEVIRKNDYRYHDEPWGDEAGAWLRVVAALAGPPFEQIKPRVR